MENNKGKGYNQSLSISGLLTRLRHVDPYTYTNCIDSHNKIARIKVIGGSSGVITYDLQNGKIYGVY